MFSLACGFPEKAAKYAKKSLEVERYCIGTDTAYLEDDLEKSAESWLRHVTNELAKQQDTVAALVADKRPTEKGHGNGHGNGNSNSNGNSNGHGEDEGKGDGKDEGEGNGEDKGEGDGENEGKGDGEDEGEWESYSEEEGEGDGEDEGEWESYSEGEGEGEGDGDGDGKEKGKKGSSAVVEKPVLGQSSDPTSTPVGQSSPSSGSRHEQATAVDSDLDLADDLAGARVASMDTEDELGDDDELENDGELENDASFARASAAAQGVRNRFNETTDENATIQDNSAAPEAGDSGTDKGNAKGKGKGKRKLKRNRKGKGNKLDQSPDPSSTPVEPSSSSGRHEQATDVDPDLADTMDGARGTSMDDDDKAGWTKVGARGTDKEKGKGKGKAEGKAEGKKA
jgi:hypothetical protein